MRRLLFSLTLLGLGLGLGCAVDRPAQPNVSARSAPDSVSFVPGRVHRYAFVWSNQSEGRGPAIVPQEVPVTAGMELRGTLEVRALDASDMIAISIEGLEHAELRVFGQNVLTDPSVLLGATAYAEVPADGSLRRVFVDPDVPPITRMLLTGIVGRVDLRTSAGAEASVPSTQGLVRARYARAGSTITRTLVEAERVDADPGPGARSPRVEGTGALILDPSGEVLELRNDDRLTIASDRETPALQASTHFEAVRVSVADEPPRPRPDVTTMVETDTLAPPDDEQARRELGRRFAEGLTSFDAWMTIRAAGNGLVPPRGFAVRAVGMLRGWPERADDMREIFDAATDARAQHLVFDLLAGAGTPEAQRVMVDVLRRDDVRGSAAYPGLVQRCGFITRPLPEVGEYLLEAESSTPASASRRALLYPMGSLARRYGAHDPILAEAMLVRVRRALDAAVEPEDAVAALAGLGNAGRPEDYDAIEARTHDEHPAVRGMAVVALRQHRTPAAGERLLAMLDDEDPYVVRQATAIIDEQRPL